VNIAILTPVFHPVDKATQGARSRIIVRPGDLDGQFISSLTGDRTDQHNQDGESYRL
jgi:hypothetical protein